MPGIILSHFLTLFFSVINKKWFVHFLFITLSYILAMGSSLIPDRDNYLEIYNEPYAINHIGNFEYAFLMLCYFFHFVLEIEFKDFLFILFFISFEIWFIITNQIFKKDNIFIAFALFMSFYGFFYFGIVIRNMVALIFLYAAFYFFLLKSGALKYIMFFVFCLLAYEFHRISGVFLLLIPLLNIKIPQRSLFWLFLLSIIIMLTGSLSFIQIIVKESLQIEGFDRVEHYVNSTDTGASIISVQILFNFIISMLLLMQRVNIDEGKKHIYDFFLNLNIMGLLVMAICWKMPSAYRLYNYFFFYNFIPLFCIFFYTNSKLMYRLRYIGSILLSFVYLIILIYCNPFMLLF